MTDVGLMTREAMERAYKLGRTEARARALVDSAVAHSMRNRGEPDERDFERYAYDIATDAAIMLLQHIYDDDAELKAARAERDRYKELEQALLSVSPRLFIQTAK
jgi:hypothetical protein